MRLARAAEYDRFIGIRTAKLRIAPLALAGLASIALSGCIFQDYFSASTGKSRTKSFSVTTPFTSTGTGQKGTIFTPTGGGNVTVTNEVVKHQFSATLPFKIDPSLPKKKKKGAAAAGGGLKSVSGTGISRMSGSYNVISGTGTFTGLAVLRFAQGKLGDACLSVTSSVTNFRNNATGTFSMLGGTKIAATSRVNGSYTATKATQSPDNAVLTLTGTMTIAGKIGKPARPLTPECSALAGQL